MLSSSSIASCLSASLGDKGLFSSANILQIAGVARYLLAVLPIFFANVRLFTPRETNEMFRHSVFTTKNLYLAPRSSRLTVNNLAILLHD